MFLIYLYIYKDCIFFIFIILKKGLKDFFNIFNYLKRLNKFYFRYFKRESKEFL